jgi:hypothetical protein
MKLSRSLFSLLLPLAIHAQNPAAIDLRGGQTVMEYTGQVTNAGTASIQVGYLNYIKGFNNVFSKGTTQDETTALFTFFTAANTTRSVLNGSIRAVTREGTTTVYLAKGPADFANPDSFRSGTSIQTSSLRQQVLIDTISSGFVVSNFNVVNSVSPFTLNGTSYQFGTPGQTFRTGLTGHLTVTSPPAGYFGGYATGTNDSVPFLSATPNPAPPANSAGLVQVTLTWGAPDASQVEIHLGAPDGILMTGGGSSGSATTGVWVPNGLNFFLQDVSGGKPLTAANTLAEVTVVVRP